MKISKVEAIPLSIPYTYGAQSHFPHIPKLDFCLVRVETDDGLVGWGDAFAYNCRTAVTAAVRDMIAPRAIGFSADSIPELNAKLQKELHIFGRGGIQSYALSG